MFSKLTLLLQILFYLTYFDLPDKATMSARKESLSPRKESLVSHKSSASGSAENSAANRRQSRRSTQIDAGPKKLGWQAAVGRVSLIGLLNRRYSRAGSVHSDSEDAQPKAPKEQYENTYQLEPKVTQRFPTKKTEDIIKSVFQSNLIDQKFGEQDLTTHLTELIRLQVKQELGKDSRYKIVVLVLMGSIAGQGAQVASRCLWYPQFDKFASYSYKDENLFAVGTVYGVYYE